MEKFVTINCEFSLSRLILQDAFALGEVILGSRSEGFYVDELLPQKFKDTMFAFMLHTPGRVNGGFHIYAENEDSKKAWMEALQGVIDGAVEPADQSVAVVTYEEDEEIYATIQWEYTASI